MNIGIDLGGSHIGVALVQKGIIKEKIEQDLIKTNDIKTYIVDNICKNIYELLNRENIKLEEINFIGISTPGVVKDNIVYNIVNLGIDEFKIAEMLNNKLNKEVKMKNDAKCAAIAEFKYGCMQGFSDSIFLTLGTGIGGAVFINNSLIEPSTFPGIELGHMVIEKNGRKCKCGNMGCFETYASMKALKQEVREKYNLKETTLSKEIINIIKNDIEKEKMSKIIENYIEYLSVGVSNLINIFEPEVIGIGGSAVYIGDIIKEKLEKNIIRKNILFNKREKINIKIATLGNNAGMIGAANL